MSAPLSSPAALRTPRRSAAPLPSGDPAERRLAEIGVLATVAIWSANFVVVKAAIGVLGPLTFTSVRYVVATSRCS